LLLLKGGKMIICVSSEKKDLDSLVSCRFGRSRYFLFFDTKKEGLLKLVKNKADGYKRGAGISAAQQVADGKASVVITGQTGPNAYNALSSFGIKIYDGSGISINEAVLKFKKNKLSPIKTAQSGPGRFRQ
jgi:predicted Fe-Mo cluster-binding NifX family protein